MKTRDEYLAMADEYISFASSCATRGGRDEHVIAMASVAQACVQLAEAQKSETRSLTVEDVKKVMDEAQEGMVVVVQALSEADELKRAFTLWKKRTLDRLGGGSHER